VGGINTYLLGLLGGFDSIQSKDIEFVIFCSPDNLRFFKHFGERKSFTIINLKWYNRKIYFLFLIIPFILNSKYLWRVFTNIFFSLFQVKKKIQENCDILYVVSTTLNLYNLEVPTMLSMHDIQHVHFPEFFSKIRLKVRYLKFENSAKAATKLQASSNFIKEDLLNYFRFLKEEDIKVITEGVDLYEFSKPTQIDIIKRYSLPQKFLFFPATLWKHKNHLLVLKALKLIEENSNIKIPLILTGGKNSAYADITNFIESNNMDYVRYLGKVSWDEMIALYQTAQFLITAVLYESSSLPILEAAASGLPIIAPKTPPNLEMANYLTLNLFDPNNVHELELLLLKCWNNPEIHKQNEYNLEKVKRYSWNNIALEYLSEFKKLNKIAHQ
jgi:glycosyltransferase involved in cell wall biosynthesis